ncbi:serine/threonine-protein kinase atg1-like [Oppia nitens]|uniref:serine/threonine-protein kinase atg1-like n=1 Tax=Oppia nitens TaxID=1686743 RepID=UPI0023DC5821|nr:serine/threonine-protein kinase atg1-like [Oppia nitens]
MSFKAMAKYNHYLVDKKAIESASKLDIKFISHVGQGGYADVYYGTFNSEKVAIKVTHKDKCNKNTLKQELEVVQHLTPIEHQNVIKFLKVIDNPDDIPNEVWLIMGWFESNDMNQLLITRKQPFNEQIAQHYFKQMVEGLQWLHRNNVVHRDIKPANLLIGISAENMNVIKYIDFGFAKIVNNNTDNSSPDKAMCTSHKGSQIYMAPEILSSKFIYYDAFKTDIYSLGIVLYEMLFNELPFLTSDFGVDREDRNDLMIALKESLTIRYPENIDVSESAKNLIENICCDSDKRLTTELILQSKWIKPTNNH